MNTVSEVTKFGESMEESLWHQINAEIDAVIKALRSIKALTVEPRYNWNNETHEELLDRISDIAYENYGLEDQLEAIRGAVTQIRDWG